MDPKPPSRTSAPGITSRQRHFRFPTAQYCCLRTSDHRSMQRPLARVKHNRVDDPRCYWQQSQIAPSEGRSLEPESESKSRCRLERWRTAAARETANVFRVCVETTARANTLARSERQRSPPAQLSASG